MDDAFRRVSRLRAVARIGSLGLATALLVSAGSLRAQGPPILGPGDHTFRLEHRDLDRRYIVHVPSAVARDRSAVVVALHGGGGSASQFKEENGLDAVSDREGFLAVYPDGTGPLAGRLLTWNAGPHCCGWAANNEVDDVAFLAAVLDDLARRTSVDGGRIYAIGHSNGSMMAYRLAAERPDLIMAIVAVAGAMDATLDRPVPPVAVLHIHSADDPRALYEGGIGPPFPLTDQRVEHQPVMRGLDAWAANNGCGPMPRVTGEREETAAQARTRGRGSVPHTVTRLVWDGCVENGAVEHLRLTGAGHGWPGSDVGWLRRRLVGDGTTLLDASDEAWAFLVQFRR